MPICNCAYLHCLHHRVMQWPLSSVGLTWSTWLRHSIGTCACNFQRGLRFSQNPYIDNIMSPGETAPEENFETQKENFKALYASAVLPTHSWSWFDKYILYICTQDLLAVWSWTCLDLPAWLDNPPCRGIRKAIRLVKQMFALALDTSARLHMHDRPSKQAWHDISCKLGSRYEL